MSSLRSDRIGADGTAVMEAANRLFLEVFADEAYAWGRSRRRDHLAKLLADPKFIALGGVGSTGKWSVRSLAMSWSSSKPERSEIYIYDLAVRAAFRRRGVATALIEALKPIAQACGAWMIFVQADPVDGPAVALYDKLGVREDVLHFDISPAAADRPPTR